MLGFLTARQAGLDDPLRLRRAESTRRWGRPRLSQNKTVSPLQPGGYLTNDGWNYEENTSGHMRSLSCFCGNINIQLLLLISFHFCPVCNIYYAFVVVVFFAGPFHCFPIYRLMECSLIRSSSSACIFKGPQSKVESWQRCGQNPWKWHQLHWHWNNRGQIVS